MRRALLVPILTLAFALPARAGGVRIVDATGTRNFPDIQAAVNAALDGDVLLVGEGSYPGFTIDGKNLSIFAAPPGAPVTVSGRVTLAHVSGSSALVGLSVVPTAYDRALSVTDCAGDVVFQDCSFRGHDGYSSPWTTQDASPAVDIAQSLRVALVHCGLVGGSSPDVLWFGNTGKHGLGLQGSSVAVYDSWVFGGSGGGSWHDYPGEGGPAADLQSSWMFASNSVFHGGDGGDDYYQPVPWEGACGGPGITLGATSSVHLLDVLAIAGAQGSPPWGGCSTPGIDNHGGLVDLLPGLARSFQLASVSVDRAPWALAIDGTPGDQVFLNRSTAPVFQYEPTLSGVCTSRLPPFPSTSALGVVPATGQLTLSVPQRLLPDNVVMRLHFLQGYSIEPAGAIVLGSPMHVLSLNWNSLPDCNGNGINDYAEVIAGVTPDLDHDLKPDGCP